MVVRSYNCFTILHYFCFRAYVKLELNEHFVVYRTASLSKQNLKQISLHDTQVVLLRCGQPLTAIGSKRSREDEKLVNATLGGETKGVIIDTRSSTAAMNSRSKGNGIFYIKYS